MEICYRCGKEITTGGYNGLCFDCRMKNMLHPSDTLTWNCMICGKEVKGNDDSIHICNECLNALRTIIFTEKDKKD